jgi:hypothetical protein
VSPTNFNVLANLYNNDEKYNDVLRRWANDLVKGQLLDGCPQTTLRMKSCSNQEGQMI